MKTAVLAALACLVACGAAPTMPTVHPVHAESILRAHPPAPDTALDCPIDGSPVPAPGCVSKPGDPPPPAPPPPPEAP